MATAYDEVPVLGVKETITLCNSLFSELSLHVEGEVANYSVNRGKFVFFDLKDLTEDSRLGCFMMQFQQGIPLEDGMRIVVDGKAGLYLKSGQFRLTVQNIQLRGEGTHKRSFELLKAKLEAEGLFSPNRKRTLPPFPTRIGVVSSDEAAGYGDFMRIANQRSGGLCFTLANVAVQGAQAEKEIIQAFEYLNGFHNLDVIVLIRGGGSMEDLHAFNNEHVARAIVRSKAPVVVGVGHEKDITIADFCADVRAATPTNAAQIVVADKQEFGRLLFHQARERHHSISVRLNDTRVAATHVLERMSSESKYRLQNIRNEVNSALSTIESLSPMRVLERGYSLTKDSKGKLLSSTKHLTEGALVHTQLADGTFQSTVTKTQ